MPKLKCLLFAIFLLLPGWAAQAAGDPYLGLRHEPSSEPAGLLIEVVPGAPAESSGLRTGDIVTAIDGMQMADAPEGDFSGVLSQALAGRQIGDVLIFSVHRSLAEIVLEEAGNPVAVKYPLEELAERIAALPDGGSLSLQASRIPQQLEIRVELGVRPDTVGPAFPSNVELSCHQDHLREMVPDFAAKLTRHMDIESQCSDLYARLDRRASPDDGYKLERTVYLLRDGMMGESITRSITGKLAEGMVSGLSGYSQIQYVAGELLDIRELPFPELIDNKEADLDEDLQLLSTILVDCDVLIKQAFADFSEDELSFLDTARSGLTESFRQYNYIDSEDENQRRIAANLRLIELSRRIDYQSLQQAQLRLSSLAQIGFLTRLEQELLAKYADHLEDEELLRLPTAVGDIVVNGIGSSWQRSDDTVLRIDLGGDDFYTNAAGSATGLSHQLGILIEFGGNDAYESSTHYSQGSGSLGCGMLIDMSGNDQYLGLQWAQGSAFLGSGVLIDYEGDDIYRGEEFCQAAGIFGSAVLFDISGNDRMEGQMKCQGFAGAQAASLLLDAAGDDYRYAKGKYPTGYGDAGIFDAWSQGCAQGFRGRASGGIAGIVDLDGMDYNEAGNFSQGGGYYFGYGFFHDIGQDMDHYIGSRYNQGFCAHQAIGVFLEEGGDDLYQTRQSVSQGLAWDESCTVFIDYAGNDRYEGGQGFSQGASAHNSICLMWDVSGTDTYEYAAGQARAGGNDYHGGSSLSIFIDSGGAEDTYSAPSSGNNLITGWPEYGFFADLPDSLSAALLDNAWLELWNDSSPN
jgi:hypothetical protein